MAGNRKDDAPETENPKPRLTPIDRSADLLPWRRAHELTRCFLYWVPVTTFPIPRTQRDWLMEFFTRWTQLMNGFGLRPEVFLQYKTIYPDLMNPLLNNMLDLIPIMGLGRRPDAPLPKPPSEGDVRKITKQMFDALKDEKPLDLPDSMKYMPDYSYWFVDKSEKNQRELFFGYGGMSLMFLKPDPKTAPPSLPISPALRKKIPILQQFDVDRVKAQVASLSDGFQAKSKELFGAGLEGEPQMKGVPFILPLLGTTDFFSQPPEVVENCFQLFDVYIRESPADRGILLAFKADMEGPLIELLKEMREQKLMYFEA